MYSFNDEGDTYYYKFTDGFNNYSIKKGLDIKVELKVLSPKTNTKIVEDYNRVIETHLQRKSKDYDIYFYYSSYSKIYGKHFENLNNYIPEQSLKGYDKRLIKETCSSKDDIFVGFPIIIYVSALFSNKELLKKYGKSPPKTWDELMETSKIIVESEKKYYNNDVVRYNGSFNDYGGSMPLYEFIHSFREFNNSTHPDIRSKTTMDALEKLKQMKNEIGEDIFRGSEDDTVISLLTGQKYLFLRYFYIPHSDAFVGSFIPGKKEGVSGSIVIPNNLAINKYISEDRKQAAGEFLRFLALKESQKEYIIGSSWFSADMELYNDTEVCNKIECDIIKNSLPLSFMDNDENIFGNDEYHKKYRSYMYDYLYDDKPLKDVLKKIEDITKIYTFSLKTDDSYTGLIIFFMLLLLFTSTIISLVFIFIKTLENRFRFLSKNLWVLTMLGSLILMSSIATLYGEVSNAKCHLRITLINVGFILSICPSLLKLISNFPEFNKISNWFEKNKYVAIIIIMALTVGLCKIFSISTYDLQDINITNKGHYRKCYMKNAFGIIIYYIVLVYDFLVIFITFGLIFMEWNLEDTKLDVRYLATALFMDTLSIILLIVIDKISFNDYVLYNVFLAVIILIFSVSNHIFIYLVRILPMFRPDTKYEDPRNILKKFSSSVGSVKPSMTGSIYNKRSMGTSSSTSSNNNMENLVYSMPSLSNKKYSIPSSSNNIYSMPSSSNNIYSMPSSSSNIYSMPSSSNNIYSMPSSFNNKYSMRSASYNKYSMPTSSYNKQGSYNHLSNNSFDVPPSVHSNMSNESKITKITKKIANYHNQKNISFN